MECSFKGAGLCPWQLVELCSSISIALALLCVVIGALFTPNVSVYYRERQVQVNGRSVREYGGTITKKGHVSCKLPSWLDSLSQKIHMTLAPGFFKHAAEHVLMNVYQPGDLHQYLTRLGLVCSVLTMYQPGLSAWNSSPCCCQYICSVCCCGVLKAVMYTPGTELLLAVQVTV